MNKMYFFLFSTGMYSHTIQLVIQDSKTGYTSVMRIYLLSNLTEVLIIILRQLGIMFCAPVKWASFIRYLINEHTIRYSVNTLLYIPL